VPRSEAAFDKASNAANDSYEDDTHHQEAPGADDDDGDYDDDVRFHAEEGFKKGYELKSKG
jgi:hypothetical protein